VKPVFGDLWDSYQLKVVQIGGNQALWDFLKEYKSETKVIPAKYNSIEAKYYAKRLAAMTQGKVFVEKPPAKNVGEFVDKVTESKFVKQTEKSLTSVGNSIDRKLNQWFK